MKIQELFRGGYLLHGEVNGRPLYLPLLIGSKHSVLIDTGCAPDVERLILPAFRRLNLRPSRLSFIINTHCDSDHTGGNYAMKQAAPRALLFCSEDDRDLIESPDKLVKLRYDTYRDKHRHFYPRATLKDIRASAGKFQRVDITFRGGERLRLADDWELLILHLPGHSKGHLGVWDLKHHTLFGGDAIHGAGYLNLDGAPALCPTYLHVKNYLSTARFIERLPIKTYCGCHWPVKHGPAIRKFCRETRDYVERAERLLLAALRSPRTLTELCEHLAPVLGAWPKTVWPELCYSIAGHLDDLLERGLIRVQRGSPPFGYVAIKK